MPGDESGIQCAAIMIPIGLAVAFLPGVNFFPIASLGSMVYTTCMCSLFARGDILRNSDRFNRQLYLFLSGFKLDGAVSDQIGSEYRLYYQCGRDGYRIQRRRIPLSDYRFGQQAVWSLVNVISLTE